MGTALGFLHLRTYNPRPRIWIERLESRRLFSVSVADGVVMVRAGDLGEEISISISDSSWAASLSGYGGRGVTIIERAAGGSPVTYTFARDRVRAIYAHGGAGDDLLRASDQSGGLLMVKLFGGDGDDTLIGGSEDDMLKGEAGNDLISGGAGNNAIFDDSWTAAPGDNTGVLIDRTGQTTGTAQVVDRVLTIETGDGPDDVMLGSLRNDPEHFYVFVNYARLYFRRDQITGVLVETHGGNDSYCYNDFGDMIDLPTTVDGGAGDDEIGGEDVRDIFGDFIPVDHGTHAPVTMIGGDGNDTLSGGGSGQAVLEGGAGDDRFFGLPGRTTIVDEPAPPPPHGPFVRGDDDSPVFFDDPGPIVVITEKELDAAQSPDSGVASAHSSDSATSVDDAGGPAAAPTPVEAGDLAPSPLLSDETSLLSQQGGALWA